MDLGLNEAQQMLKTSAQDFLSAECPDTYVREMEEDERGYTPELWTKIAEQGWLGLIIPEQYGGVELEFQDLVVLLEEMGRYMLPGPFFFNGSPRWNVHHGRRQRRTEAGIFAKNC